MPQTVEIFKAMSDPLRLRILRLLRQREACVCELVYALEVPQYRASKHLRVLRHAGLVADRREGNWVYYSLTARTLPLLAAVFDALEKQPVERGDRWRRDDRRFADVGHKRAAGMECA